MSWPTSGQLAALAGHVAVTSTVLVGSSLTPCIATGQKWHEDIWFTDSVGLGDLLGWMFCLITGHMYVGKFTCKRNCWTEDRRGGFKSIKRLIIAGFIAWPFGPRFVLTSCVNWTHSTNVGAEAASMILRNVACFGVAYSIGIMWSYLDRIPMFQHVTLRCEDIRQWSKRECSIVASIALFVLSLAAMQLYILYDEDRLLYYIPILVFAFTSIAITAYFVRNSHYIHVHHYMLFGFFMFFCATRHLFSVCLFGLTAGIAVEGIARWGMDPLLYLKAPSDSKEAMVEVNVGPDSPIILDRSEMSTEEAARSRYRMKEDSPLTLRKNAARNAALLSTEDQMSDSTNYSDDDSADHSPIETFAYNPHESQD